MGRRLTSVIVAALATTGMLLGPAADAAVTGSLKQLAVPNNCIKQGGGECTTGRIGGGDSVVVSPDNKNAYSASAANGGVAVYSRASTGELTQLAGANGCITNDGSAGACTDGRAFVQPAWLAVSADGQNVYTVASNSNAIAVMSRDGTTGALTQLAGTSGCVQEGVGPDGCFAAVGLSNPVGAAVSPDGKSVYAVSNISSAIAEFSRAVDGSLTQLSAPNSCIGADAACTAGTHLNAAYAVVVSPDNKNVYVAAFNSNAIVTFSRDTSTGALTQGACINQDGSGGCSAATGIDGPVSLAMSPNGKNLYVASYNTPEIALFKRDTTTGALKQLSDPHDCIAESGPDCAHAKGFSGGGGFVRPTVTSDGRFVYVASEGADAVSEFSRSSTSGALKQLAKPNRCVSELGDDGCRDGTGLDGAGSVAVSTNKTGAWSLYVGSIDEGAIAEFKRVK